MRIANYRDVLSFRNMMRSSEECVKNVRWKPSVQNFEINRLQWVAELHQQVLDHTYKSKGFYEFDITERGKKRHIRSVHISERCVQKCVSNYGVKPLVVPMLIYDNAASLEGKGTEFALKRLRKHLATHYRKHGRKGGILTIDFHDYFNSVPHQPLFDIYKRAMADPELYELSVYFIKCFGKRGLGLGSELSQISAILYPNELDHYIKEQLHIKGYARYMDDSYLIHEDIDYLKYCRREIEQRLKKMGLTVNPKTQITRFDTGNSFIFLKRRYSISESGKIITRLQRKNVTKRRRILKRQKKLYSEGKADLGSIKQSYESWRGYARKWDDRRTVQSMDHLFYELFGVEHGRKCDNADNHKTK